MAEKITWTNSRCKLSELIPWEINPATIGKDEARRLEESLNEFGQVQELCVSPTKEIYDGHQRKMVWSASRRFGPDYEVDIRVSSRPLTEQERKKLVIYLRRGTVGTFDFDIMANHFEMEDLVDWGIKPYEMGIVPASDDWASAMDKLPDEDRAPFQQMTFTLHDTQAEQVKAALEVAKKQGAFVDSPNENSNGNALARICETFVTEYGNG